MLSGLGDPSEDDLHLACKIRVLDPVVEGPSLEGVVHVPGAVRGEDHHWRYGRPERADLGHRYREVGQDLEQVGLELVVGTIDLVDEEDGRSLVGRAAVGDRPQEGSADQEPLREELVLGDGIGAGPPVSCPQIQKLALVVPLVQGLRGVDSLVALEADQVAADPSRQSVADLRLAHARLALQEERTPHHDGEEDRGRQSPARQVSLGTQRPLDVLGRRRRGPPWGLPVWVWPSLRHALAE